jgi:hypothetical protein
LVRQTLFDALLFVTCAYALYRGGSPERLVAITLFGADILSVVVVADPYHRFHHEEMGVMLVDVAVFVILMAVALRSTRFWPLYLAGLQLDGVGVHAVRMVVPGLLPMAYMNAIALWAYPMQIILAVGAFRSGRRVREWGHDRPWRRADVAGSAVTGWPTNSGRRPDGDEAYQHRPLASGERR